MNIYFINNNIISIFYNIERFTNIDYFYFINNNIKLFNY